MRYKIWTFTFSYAQKVGLKIHLEQCADYAAFKETSDLEGLNFASLTSEDFEAIRLFPTSTTADRCEGLEDVEESYIVESSEFETAPVEEDSHVENGNCIIVKPQVPTSTTKLAKKKRLENLLEMKLKQLGSAESTPTNEADSCATPEPFVSVKTEEISPKLASQIPTYQEFCEKISS